LLQLATEAATANTATHLVAIRDPCRARTLIQMRTHPERLKGAAKSLTHTIKGPR
jgi:hypothetical protein